jgi:GNAT superfamily N-acetyltransferase
LEVSSALDDPRTAEVESLLRGHNQTANPGFLEALGGPEGEVVPLKVFASNPGGDVVGGLVGHTRFSWLKLEILAVSEEERRGGIATRLLERAEREALKRGCRYVFSDGMEYHSPGFYTANGFHVAGHVDDWDSRGHEKFFWFKEISSAPPREIGRTGLPEVRVRPFEPRDSEAVEGIVESLGDWFDERARTRSIPTDLRHQDAHVALLAETVAGFMTLFVSQGRLNIGWIGVHRDLRRRGVGSALIESAAATALDSGIGVIATTTLGGGIEYEPYESTRAFYRRQGFEVYQTDVTDNPSCPEEIRISKIVAPPR